MSGHLLLDWAVLSVSLFNTIVLLWLGLTVLLNAERRTWGIWVAGGGLLVGGAFFVSHSAILGHNLTFIGPGTEFWWRLGWAPLIALPYAWYVLMLWYAGFWDERTTRRLHRRHQPWLVGISLIAGVMFVLSLLGQALPSYWQLIQYDLSAAFSLGRLPLLLAIYPGYAVLCVMLALRVLAHPVPSSRVMGDRARRRARSWLVAASGVLLGVSVIVALALGWVTVGVQRDLGGLRDAVLVTGIAWFDLVAASGIGVAVVLLGQAIVAYEVFTGRSLPRRGFSRHWRRAVVLAGGYSVLVAGSVVGGLRPIYSLLLTALLMTAFYALLVWRSFSDRERTLAQLRPFVSSQRLMPHVLDVQASPDVNAVLSALCNDVLGAQRIVLVPVGATVPLMGTALAFPPDTPPPALPAQELVAAFAHPGMAGMAVELERYGGTGWVVPLWAENRLAGLLLLGDKRDGGFYTQEEIELARAGGEQLLDLCAGAEMARRLMIMQRQKLSANQIVDQRTRRVLHDEVLPNLHAALLSISAGDAGTEVARLLEGTHRQVADLLRAMPVTGAPTLERLGLVGALRRVVEGELPEAFDDVTWQVSSEAEARLRALAPLTAEVVYYAAREVFRNAAHHGRDGHCSDPFVLSVRVTGEGGAVIRIEDNGKGIDPSRVPESDSGQGLALHSTMMAVIGGTLELDSVPGGGTRVTLRVPDQD